MATTKRYSKHSRGNSSSLALNGSNGEWTNSDDVAGKKSKKNSKSLDLSSIKASLKSLAKKKTQRVIVKGIQKSKILESIGRAGGMYAGAALGRPVQGSVLGGQLGKSLSRILGHGDYEAPLGGLETVAVNSIVKGPIRAEAQFSATKGGVRIQHREFIKNVVASGTAFSNDAVRVQPGSFESFPFLASVASCYTQYKLHGCVYEYVSTVSEYSSIAQMGSVVMACNYNVGDALFTNKSAMENSTYAVSARPDKNICMGLECQAFTSPLVKYLIRVGDTPNVPTSLEDFATVQIGLCNLPVAVYPLNSVVGELWVTYDIELTYPKLPIMYAGLYAIQRSGSATANPCGTATNSVQYRGVCYNCSIGGAYIYFTDVPIGTVLLVELLWSMAATAWTAFTVTGTGAIIDTSFSSTGVVSLPPNGTAGTTQASMLFNVQISTDNAYITLTGGAAGAGTFWANVISLGQGVNFTSLGP